uniref:Mei2-like C-terminal RNA recognition motif domain-containing protein n=1 Tax=Ananas comosus var. bracteatus TaxID=296719 RepID=A0A6V7PIT9_ANACO|nr:unnamed protein product [Ananas comosus var. bracteatus]
MNNNNNNNNNNSNNNPSTSSTTKPPPTPPSSTPPLRPLNPSTTTTRSPKPSTPATTTTTSPHPPYRFPGQRAIIEEFKERDHQTTAGDNATATANAAEEDVRVRSYGCFGRKKIFAPKPKSRRKPSSASPPQLLHSSVPLLQKRRPCAEFEFGCNEENKTTVMIKNLPNKFAKEKLICILDQHCVEENQKLRYLKRGEDGEGSQEIDSSEFDFFYLPIDFRSGSNLGYAFVNFTTPAAAWRLHRFLHNYEWKLHGSRKVCEVTYARIQGLEALLRHFKNSVFICGYDEFLPVSFDPPRDGVRRPEQQFIGKRLSPTSLPPAGLKGRKKGEE